MEFYTLTKTWKFCSYSKSKMVNEIIENKSVSLYLFTSTDTFICIEEKHMYVEVLTVVQCIYNKLMISLQHRFHSKKFSNRGRNYSDRKKWALTSLKEGGRGHYYKCSNDPLREDGRSNTSHGQILFKCYPTTSKTYRFPN